MVSHRPFQRIQPLSLLAQLISRRVDGCLQIVSGSISWLLYLDEGTLAFATNSTQPFDRLDRVLDQLRDRVPSLTQLTQAQLRQFETVSGTYPATSADYQAIEWLIAQGFLDRSQATELIELLAIEVLKPFLTVTEGMYEVIAKANFLGYPNLCRLDLRPIVERCHSELRSRQSVPPKATRPDAAFPTAPSARSLSFTTPQPNSTPIAAVPTGSAGIGSATATAQAQYKIACIDDSPTVLQAISTFLNDSSVSVIMINDPVKALMQVVRSKPDIILLDVGMPNLDGYELCSLLRRHPSFKQTPIIMVTGHTGFIDRAKAKIAGASGYLTKPFTQSELVKTVFRYLE
ncbi:MAG: response regulator [Leptolyngbya sp. Prado105]|jgi:twitching motility two-component system response regulator PilG|nr:response regulator [Leptolyngbya sp. Prado105]